MESSFTSINADCARLIFERLEAHDIAHLANTGCKAMRKRVFSSIETLHVSFKAANLKIASPISFVSECGALKTLVLGELHATDGPFVPGLDLAKLPASITHLELNIANGTLALLKLSSTSLNASSHGTTCHPLKTIMPNLQHLHVMNGYRLDYDPFPGLDILDELSQLSLLTLTYAPFYVTLPSLNKLPSTLVALKIDCINWMKSESVVKVKWPKSLKSLELLNVDGNVLGFLDNQDLPTGLERLRIDVDDAKSEQMKSTFNLETLPSSLLSLHFRYIGLTIPKKVFANLPPKLDELRLFLFEISNLDEGTSVYELVPRSLRTLHLFCVAGSPQQGAFYDHLPRGLVDFCCDRPFGLHAPPASKDAGKASDADEDQGTRALAGKGLQLATLPSSLVRSRITPPKVDCRPDDLLPISLRQYRPNVIEEASSAPSDDAVKGEGAGMVEETEDEKASSKAQEKILPSTITDIDLPVGTAILDFEEKLSNVKRIGITESGSEIAKPELVNLLRRLPHLTTLEMGSNAVSKTLLETTNPKTEPVPHLDALIINHGRDGFNHGRWSHLANGPLATLQTFEYPLKWFTTVSDYMPPTLTELSLIRPRSYIDEEIYTSIIPVMGRPLELFKSLPRTLLRLRCGFPFLYEGNIFALLPPKLQELHLHGTKSGFWTVPPNIPVDQLFHLPVSITRLTLPTYDKTSEGIRLHGPGDIELLQRFFAERPQLRTFSIWQNEYARAAFDFKAPNGLTSQTPTGPYQHDADWVFLTYNTPSRVSHIGQLFHPASSLDIAIKSTLTSASIPIEASRPSAPTSSPASSRTEEAPAPAEKKKKDKAKGGGFFSRLFGKSSEPAKPVEEPISAASTSERAAPGSSFVYIEPETEKTKHKPQLGFSAIASVATSPDAPFTQISDSATSTDNGYAEFWANETLRRQKAGGDERKNPSKKRK